jgi:hypothetical protein
MTPEVNLLYSLFANHPADGRELSNIGKRGSYDSPVSARRGRRLSRLALRRSQPVSTPSHS